MPDNNVDAMDCAICGHSLDDMSEEGRQEHYEVHFSEPGPIEDVNVISASTSTAGPPSASVATSSLPKIRRSLLPIGKNAGKFWTVSRANVEMPFPPSNITPGLIPIIKRALEKSHAKGTTQRAALCQNGISHIATEFFDTTYGCGYRNFMMACTSLYEQPVMPQYASCLDVDGGPGLQPLQILLEKAWSEGYDQIGASQLKHKLVGTMKWIGTGELHVAFIYRGIPSQLIDFPQVTNPEVVTRWVANYFFPPNATGNINSALSGASPIIQTEKPPLILQHQGHSRTIIGIEINRTGAHNLLIFDPGKRASKSLREQALSSIPSLSKGSTIKTSNAQFSSPSSAKRTRADEETEHGDEDEDRNDDDNYNSNEERPRKRGKLDGTKSFLSNFQNFQAIRSSENDYLNTLKFVRVNLSNLKKKDKYQILAFTLEPPMTEAERQSRKVIGCETVI